MTYYYPFKINRNSKIAEKNRTYYHKGKFEDIIKIIEKTIFDMELVVKNRVSQNTFFHVTAHEKMKFISTSFPLNFEISVNKFEKFTLVKIKTWSNMFAINQEANSKKRADEFLSRIQNFGGVDQQIQQHVPPKIHPLIARLPPSQTHGSDVSVDDFETLKRRYKNGEITKEEYKRLKKKTR